MDALVEHESPKAGRILAAARELLLKRGVKGVSIAEIAERAHVGKGTVYLYWATKEDLLLGLCARDFLDANDQFVSLLTNDFEVALPKRFCPLLLRSALTHPFVRAIQEGDDEVLGVLTEHPKAHELLDKFGPGAMLRAVLPLWRKHGMASTDWTLDAQVHVLRALLAGFTTLETHATTPPNLDIATTDDTLAAAVEALLGPPRATQQDNEAVAAQGLRLLGDARVAVLAAIASTNAR
jgi:AcrR family transcriptional regulator